MTNFHIITLFPKLFPPYLSESILGRAKKNKFVSFSYYNPREFTLDKHRKVDAKPYGGGPGMVMSAEPILRAVDAARGKKKDVKVVLLSPQGRELTNTKAQKLSKYKNIILISGRYEGIDARVKKALRAEEISIGPYVLTGGELPALVLIDAVTRQIPGVLGSTESIEEKRIAGRDVYTRPAEFIYRRKKFKVPKVLQSGHHKKIDDFRVKNRKG
tara:strand:- start:30596 stop:31240 length:645 start_codon:yes stop_codon:yes gene_type:complete